MISGTVTDLLSGYQISVQIFEPEFGNIVYINQFGVGMDKTFSHQLTAGGPGWFSAGEYRVVVTYGTESRVAETTFDYSGSKTPRGTTIDVEGFLVGYKITGGSIISITPDVDASSLIIEISTTSDGELIITLPRALADAKLNGCEGDDDDFFVLIDGEEVEFDETRTDMDRTLTIAFPDGASEIEIIGTCVVPEFGAIAALILAVAIISIIVVSAKTRLSLMPRY
jgi:predicted secreted protein with PEFG-CTERM motif